MSGKSENLLNLVSCDFCSSVIILFTKADLLDAQTIEQLVESGMSIEDATYKAGEESIINFDNDFGHVLYAKKYPPKMHIYFWGKEFHCQQRQ